MIDPTRDRQLRELEEVNLCAQILYQARNELYLNMRFLDIPLSSLGFEAEWGLNGIRTDGFNIYYGPDWLTGLYGQGRVRVNRAYLHMLFHCLFGHLDGRGEREISDWNLACDIAVEGAIEELHLSCAAAIRGHAQGVFTQTLKKKIKLLTAEKIYAWLLDNPLSDDALAKMQRAFEADSHDIWYLRNSSAFAQDGEGEGEPGQSLILFSLNLLS